eukprot:CAMPEP_0178403576 /NCGR_PEP_ID=MMETSP0689_2-20121128/17440_1 /TAXON_ID=160604 /ORGANISM="Amphidinium massartii, Strain CS-259" /LENGTH=571 /DNA_ID=CAMNT_0020024535 /DNA_START=35 /DNA_END=1750 /DNA_ORIENTATION=-
MTEPAGEETRIIDAATREGLGASVKYLVKAYLDDSHYNKLYDSLSAKWDRMHSLSAAMMLMEQYGVKLEPSEVERLSGMDQMQQINALVSKMPQQSNEQFQHFFLQLQLIVQTATRVRQALEDGRPEQVQAALDDADSTGISQYIMKMAIVQAGTEVTQLRKGYQESQKEWNWRMSKLIRAQEDAMQAQKRLHAAQAQLAEYTTGQNEKAKKVLMSMCNDSKVIMLNVMKEWVLVLKRDREEAEIRKEFEGRIEAAREKLVEFKSRQLQKTRAVLSRKGVQKDMEVVADVVRIWRETIEEQKFQRENSQKLHDLEARLGDFKNAQVSTAKSVMLRMQQNGDLGCLAMALNAWTAFHGEVLRDKETEKAVKEAEERLQGFLKGKNDNAKNLLNNMASSTDSGLIQEVFQAWLSEYLEAKKERDLEQVINGSSSKFASFGLRNKESGKSLAERAQMYQDHFLLLDIIGAWRLETKMNLTLQKYQAKIEGKKQQLMSVQKMFRDFAQQLERDLHDADSARDAHFGKRMVKGEGSVSLPDIHTKQGYTTPKPSAGRKTYDGKEGSSRSQPRPAWG